MDVLCDWPISISVINHLSIVCILPIARQKKFSSKDYGRGGRGKGMSSHFSYSPRLFVSDVVILHFCSF